ncbi:MAG: hypothetical protein Q7S27_01645 [Nanoarchaeota archaeon]|nr:hypothetical protein [Nanoarchaeota archaeon]
MAKKSKIIWGSIAVLASLEIFYLGFRGLGEFYGWFLFLPISFFIGATIGAILGFIEIIQGLREI